MPLIRRDSPDKAADQALESIDLLAKELRDPDAERRWAAARRIGATPGAKPGEHRDAVAHLGSALAQESDPRVLEAIFTSLIRIGGDDSVLALLPWLRSDDAVRRSGAIEALQMMPDAIDPHMAGLLQDSDSDVRILSCELVRKLPRERATSLLSDMLDRDEHPNVCAAAIDVLAEVGTSDAVPSLERCRERFIQDPFLPFAISATVESIRNHAT